PGRWHHDADNTSEGETEPLRTTLKVVQFAQHRLPPIGAVGREQADGPSQELSRSVVLRRRPFTSVLPTPDGRYGAGQQQDHDTDDHDAPLNPKRRCDTLRSARAASSAATYSSPVG